MEKAYISIGSNKGNRFYNLREALVQIQKQIGVLTNLSSIYESSAWGFEGPDFFNACVEIQTDFSALELLEKLLEIERQMGRIRSINPGYNSREIDLDLLFFEDQIINNEHLILPHPRLDSRNFILHPMCEIAPDLVHPQLEKDMSSLSDICRDNSNPSKLPLSQWSLDIFSKDQFLVFEGNIGVGKTSLAKKISDDFQARSLLENFSQNPYLENFYAKPDRFALYLENYFLEDRFRQFKNFLEGSAAHKFAVADHSLFKSLVFAKINLSPLNFIDFKNNFERLARELVFSQKVIFLKKPIQKLMDQIINRGRSYEQKITSDYLEKIESGYQNFENEGLSFTSNSIDLTNLDFVHDERAYQIILQRIKAF